MQPEYPPMPAEPYAAVPVGGATPAYANWFIRVASYVIDYILPWIIGGIVQLLYHGDSMGVGRGLLGALLSLLSIAIIAINRWFRMGRTGQSWGKSITHTRLLGIESGQPIGALRSFLRDLLHILDALIIYIGFLWPIWDRKRQTLFGDKVMKTVVINV